MDSLFNEIKAKILADLPEIAYVQMYNSQFEDLGGEQGALVYSFPSPFILVEFDDDIEWHQLGNGVQIADPLFITLHIGHNQLDAMDGTMEQNLDVYQLAKRVFNLFNKYEAAGTAMLIRVGHTQDKQHDNMYHFQQKYKTNYIDQSNAEPVNGITIDPPFTLDLTTEYNPKPFLKNT